MGKKRSSWRKGGIKKEFVQGSFINRSRKSPGLEKGKLGAFEEARPTGTAPTVRSGAKPGSQNQINEVRRKKEFSEEENSLDRGDRKEGSLPKRRKRRRKKRRQFPSFGRSSANTLEKRGAVLWKRDLRANLEKKISRCRLAQGRRRVKLAVCLRWQITVQEESTNRSTRS